MLARLHCASGIALLTLPLAFLRSFIAAVAKQAVLREDGADLDETPYNFSIDEIVEHFVNKDEVDAAGAAKLQAQLQRDDFQGRCTKAEDRLRDIEEDQRALKKQYMRKITKLQKELEDAQAASQASQAEVGEHVGEDGLLANDIVRCVLID